MTLDQTPQLNLIMSVKPIFASKIMDGSKTVELRRRFPASTPKGATVFLYSSSPVQAIVACIELAGVEMLPISNIWSRYAKAACIERDEFGQYFSGLQEGYAILLGRVFALKNQIELSQLRERFRIVPPRSFRYLNGEHASFLHHAQLQISNRRERRHRVGGQSPGRFLLCHVCTKK